MFTVESGERFVVSASSEQVVFRKSVGAAAFPFDEASLLGKAILVHPVAGRAEDGVFARATRVRSEGDRYAVDVKPLSFLEMETVTEDEIVRVYVDSRRTASAGAPRLGLAPATLRPLGVFPSLQLSPLSEEGGDGFSWGDLGIGSGSDTPIAKANRLAPGVSFKHSVDRASFTPDVLVDWSREAGLELGFRADMEWRSRAVINGTLTGEFFRSNAWESPALWISLPIGIVTVPVRASVKVLVTCKATLVGPADVTLDVRAGATVGGSFRVRPSAERPASEWVTAGSWPGVATGTVSVDPSWQLAFRGAIACALPRIELHTKIFGAVGPVAIVMPTAVVATEGVRPEVRFAAGLEAGIFGVGDGLEIPVYTLPL